MSRQGRATSERKAARQSRREILALSLAAATFGIALGMSEAEAAEETKGTKGQSGKASESGKKSGQGPFIKLDRQAPQESQKQSGKGSTSRSSTYLKRSVEEK
jgi:hypothetical protein